MKRKLFRWLMPRSPIMLQAFLGYMYGVSDLMGWKYTLRLTRAVSKEAKKYGRSSGRNSHTGS